MFLLPPLLALVAEQRYWMNIVGANGIILLVGQAVPTGCLTVGVLSLYNGSKPGPVILDRNRDRL
jgi:hypothetical protein